MQLDTLVRVCDSENKNAARSNGDRFLLSADQRHSDCRVVYSGHRETQSKIVAALLSDFIGKSRVVCEISEIPADVEAVKFYLVLQVSNVFSDEAEAW